MAFVRSSVSNGKAFVVILNSSQVNLPLSYIHYICYQPVLSGQQGFQGLMGVQQSPHSQGVLSSQQGAPVQGVMVSYPTMSSYQVPMTQGSQAVPQQTYQPPIMLPNQAGQGSLPATGMPVYCNVTPPSPQNNALLNFTLQDEKSDKTPFLKQKDKEKTLAAKTEDLSLMPRTYVVVKRTDPES
ncbi:hypothetical protein STEG23_022460 [Scotinomys teguina]